MNPEESYYANSDEGEIKRLREQVAVLTAERDAARGQVKHWKYLKEHYYAKVRDMERRRPARREGESD